MNKLTVDLCRQLMEPLETPNIADIDRFRSWEPKASRCGRFFGRLGLQSKIILSAGLLMSVALGGSCVVFVWQTQARLQNLMGEQTLQMSTALASSSVDQVTAADKSGLERTASNLIKGRNIVYVGYCDANGNPIIEQSRSTEATASTMVGRIEPKELLRVHRRSTNTLGDYFEVTAPVIATGNERSLVGYVTVGLSDRYESMQMQRVNVMVVGVGLIAALLGLPLAYITVGRIVRPIRELVKATQKIIAGDLEARVATGRPDEIGELARAFNDMVLWVKNQQCEVKSVNGQLAEANRDLEQKIEQRTSQLETANQRLSSEIAEKEDFIRAVSHDLNAPLRNIAGMTTMLLMKHKAQFTEDIVHRLERIKSNVEIETDLINELLELSRIKTRRQTMELVDVEQMIWELRGLFENDLKSKNIEIRLDSSLPQLSVERARIRQVFQNLIDNAIKYMGDGADREIHIGCTVRHTEAEFWVRDTGLGIEPEDVDKVFFVFRRGKSSSVQNIAGKGVGLASVKSIVETYSGRIWVESKLGAGSTFRFTLNGKHVPATTGGVVYRDPRTTDDEMPVSDTPGLLSPTSNAA